MPFYKNVTASFRILLISWLVLLVAGCDSISNLLGSGSGSTESAPVQKEVVELSLAVTNRAIDMPWLLAEEEGKLDHSKNHSIQLRIEKDDYRLNIDKFVAREVDAISINNIDAIAQIVRQDIEADVILIAGYSDGNEAILLPDTANPNIVGKPIALEQFSSRHYLLDRYLVRRQIAFDAVPIIDTSEANIPDVFGTGQAYGVVTANPNLSRLLNQGQASVLFDSRQIPNEIVELIVVQRDVLFSRPRFAQALLATWFPIMERLQGNRRGSTLDAMAKIANMSREDFDRQMETMIFASTPATALSGIRRDRIMRKAMRHIRYFMERHELTGNEAFTGWVSYPGRTPALLHFNASPLQEFVAPPKARDL